MASEAFGIARAMALALATEKAVRDEGNGDRSEG